MAIIKGEELRRRRIAAGYNPIMVLHPEANYDDSVCEIIHVGQRATSNDFYIGYDSGIVCRINYAGHVRSDNSLYLRLKAQSTVLTGDALWQARTDAGYAPQNSSTYYGRVSQCMVDLAKYEILRPGSAIQKGDLYLSDTGLEEQYTPGPIEKNMCLFIRKRTQSLQLQAQQLRTVSKEDRVTQPVEIKAASDLHSKFLTVRSELNTRFMERSSVIDGLLTASVAKQHVLLLGSPGAAKSALVNTFTSMITDASCFSWLLTKFTTPEEIFGPLSLKGLQEDRFERMISGRAPSAPFLFLDEVWKASSSILNSLLSLLNERIFHNNGQVVKCPLITCVGASNELPEGEDLSALFDRFAFKYWVPYVKEEKSILELLGADDKDPPAQLLSLVDIGQAQEEAKVVTFGKGTVESLLQLLRACQSEGIVASDRKWRQCRGILKARAWLMGSASVTEDHFDCLADVLWKAPKERETLLPVIAAAANPYKIQAEAIRAAAQEQLTALGATAHSSSAGHRAEWLKKVSNVNRLLADMLANLQGLQERAGEKKAPVAAIAKEVTEWQAGLFAKVAQACAPA